MTVQALLAAGADPTRKTTRGDTALDLAKRTDFEAMVALLQAAGG